MRANCAVILMLFATVLLTSCGKHVFYQAGQSRAPVMQRVLLLKEHCDDISKGHLYFYRLNGRLIKHSKKGFEALWLHPGSNRITMKFIAKGEDYRYIYTSYADVLLDGDRGRSYRVRYKRTEFKTVRIWFEQSGKIIGKDLPTPVCKQNNYKIPYDWRVY